jgi:hypothetical protein
MLDIVAQYAEMKIDEILQQAKRQADLIASK